MTAPGDSRANPERSDPSVRDEWAFDRTAASVSSRADNPSLTRAIETEIIPRLMMIHRQGRLGENAAAMGNGRGPTGARPSQTGYKEGSDTSHECEPSAGGEAIDSVDVEKALSFAVEGAISGLSDFLLDLMRTGLSAEDVLFDVLTPVARRLGEDWVQDVRDFTDVTVGVGTLQHVMRSLRSLDAPDLVPGTEIGRVLFCPTPGDQHTFGLLMVETLFRLRGWSVRCETNLDEHGIDAALKGEPFTLLALSLGSESLLSRLQNVIRIVRDHSLNDNVGILIGGPAFAKNTGLADQVDADAVALDGYSALQAAEGWRLKHPLTD